MSCPSTWRFSTKEELMKKKIITAIAAVLVILAIAAAGFFGGIRYVEVQNEKKKPTVDTVSLTEELAEISELASVEYSYTNSVRFENHLDFYGYKIPFTTNYFVLTYDGSIKAGVDLSRAQISLEGEMITVTLPPAVILSHEIDYDSMQATDETYSFFNRIDITDYTSFTKDQNSKMEKKALEAGLLQKARENAILAVREFIITSNPGFSVVVI